MMFIHLGGDIIVKLQDVVAIFNIEKGSKKNRAFLQQAEEQNMVIIPPEDDAKTFVITIKGIYYSSISSVTLKKRAQMPLEH